MQRIIWSPLCLGNIEAGREDFLTEKLLPSVPIDPECRCFDALPHALGSYAPLDFIGASRSIIGLKDVQSAVHQNTYWLEHRFRAVLERPVEVILFLLRLKLWRKIKETQDTGEQ